MSFAVVPPESRKKIDKAGKILIHENPNGEDLVWALDLAERWRACHSYPINTFQSNLRDKIRCFSREPIVAQRLKRMPTIIDKLKREPTMKLTTMQDIGGLRAILNSVNDVYRLADKFRNSKRLAHELIDQKDYIQNPRSEDGYRSLHLIYKYKNSLAPMYNGLRLELQIRTKLQHTWATAVETMGTFLGQALKSRQGDREWLDFFAIVSSAFSHMEKTSPVPRFNQLDRIETFKAVKAGEQELQALDKMAGFSVAANSIVNGKRSAKSWSYHLVILDSLKKTVVVVPYDRDSISKAVVDYAETEARAADGEKIEPVLVSAGPLEKLRRAYPNFFLDIKGFVSKVRKVILEADKE